jgi:hypothetical protein
MRFIVQFDDKMYRFVTFGLHNNFTNETHSLFAVFCMQFEVFTPLALHLGGYVTLFAPLGTPQLFH